MSTDQWRAAYERNGHVDLWVEEEFNSGSRLVVRMPLCVFAGFHHYFGPHVLHISHVICARDRADAQCTMEGHTVCKQERGHLWGLPRHTK